MIVGFIGTGNMGGAILKGYAASENFRGNGIILHNRNRKRSESIVNQVVSACPGAAVEICESNVELAERSDIVIIGVKPAGVPEVLREIAGFAKSDKLIISMAAGVTIESMEDALGDGAPKIIRIMPNTPVQVGEGMTSLSRNLNVTDADMARAKAIFDSVGSGEEVSEEMIDCVIGVSGSSPAYTYMYIEALSQGAVENGMDADSARKFAAQAVIGAAKLAMASPESLRQLRENVCSPGGTTIEAVKALQENGFMDSVKQGFQAAVDRSKEMSGERFGRS